MNDRNIDSQSESSQSQLKHLKGQTRYEQNVKTRRSGH